MIALYSVNPDNENNLARDIKDKVIKSAEIRTILYSEGFFNSGINEILDNLPITSTIFASYKFDYLTFSLEGVIIPRCGIDYNSIGNYDTTRQLVQDLFTARLNQMDPNLLSKENREFLLSSDNTYLFYSITRPNKTTALIYF